MEEKTLEQNLENIRDELKETTWAARNYNGYKGALMGYQKKYLGRTLDRAKYDIRRYR